MFSYVYREWLHCLGSKDRVGSAEGIECEFRCSLLKEWPFCNNHKETVWQRVHCCVSYDFYSYIFAIRACFSFKVDRHCGLKARWRAGPTWSTNVVIHIFILLHFEKRVVNTRHIVIKIVVLHGYDHRDYDMKGDCVLLALWEKHMDSFPFHQIIGVVLMPNFINTLYLDVTRAWIFPLIHYTRSKTLIPQKRKDCNYPFLVLVYCVRHSCRVCYLKS